MSHPQTPAGEPEPADGPTHPAAPDVPRAGAGAESRPEGAPGEPPGVPHQAAPQHDQPTAPVFAPGSAPIPSQPAPPGAYAPPPAEHAKPPIGYAQPTAEPTAVMPLGAPPLPGHGGYPGAVAGAAPAPGSSRRGLVVLAVLCVVFFLMAGLLGGLYIGKIGELNQTRRDLSAQVREHEATIADQKSEIDELKVQLQSAKDEVERVRQDLTGTRNAAEELRRQKDVISRCLNLLGEASLLAEQGRTSQARAKLNEAAPVCDEADRYLN